MAAVVAATALGAACGIPSDDGPRMVSDGDVPFGLLDGTTSTSIADRSVTTSPS